MPSRPTISVIMPVRNARLYVKRAIDSILDQTFSCFELIILDDASADGTDEVLKEIAKNDSRILLMRNEKRYGVTKTLNIGLGRATGRYIARQDADDWSAKRRFETQLAYLEQNPQLGLVGTWINHVDSSGALLRVKKWPETSEAIRQALVHVNVITHGSILGRYELFSRCGGYREVFKVSQDRDLWLRATEQFALGNVPETLYSLRIHKESVSATHKQQKAITNQIIFDCVDLRRRNGIDIFQTPYAGKAPNSTGVNTRKLRSYDLLLSLPEPRSSRRNLRIVGILSRCIFWWPSNKYAWDWIASFLKREGHSPHNDSPSIS